MILQYLIVSRRMSYMHRRQKSQMPVSLSKAVSLRVDWYVHFHVLGSRQTLKAPVF